MTLILASNRRKAVERLRTTKEPQGFGGLYDRRTGHYCALGHIGLAVGIDAAKHPAVGLYDKIDTAVDMPYSVSFGVQDKNDSERVPLCEIGDYLAREWGIE